MKNSSQCMEFFVGIDVSKLTLDVTAIHTASKSKKYIQVENNDSGLNVLNHWLHDMPGFAYAQTVLCFEHTGMYTRVLLDYLLSQSANVWMESSLQIKKSLGLNRGKNDKIDSCRIA
ncbi:MAG TPA: transposase, partial [Bacteroidales bacterium]|nr:transposase [Bacteroidales bacterium]